MEKMASRKGELDDGIVPVRGVLGTGFWNGANILKQYFVLPKNGSKYYLKYTFLSFLVLGIWASAHL